MRWFRCMLHYSPEPRVIERLITSANPLGLTTKPCSICCAYRVAFATETDQAQALGSIRRIRAVWAKACGRQQTAPGRRRWWRGQHFHHQHGALLLVLPTVAVGAGDEDIGVKTRCLLPRAASCQEMNTLQGRRAGGCAGPCTLPATVTWASDAPAIKNTSPSWFSCLRFARPPRQGRPGHQNRLWCG